MPTMSRRILVLLLVALLAVLSISDPAVAQRSSSADHEALPAEGAPWGAIAISVGFAAAVAYLGFMNSKRTHLD